MYKLFLPFGILLFLLGVVYTAPLAKADTLYTNSGFSESHFSEITEIAIDSSGHAWPYVTIIDTKGTSFASNVYPVIISADKPTEFVINSEPVFTNRPFYGLDSYFGLVIYNSNTDTFSLYSDFYDFSSTGFWVWRTYAVIANYQIPYTSDYDLFAYTVVDSDLVYGSIDSISDAGLLAELYDITFTVQGVSSDNYSNLISRVYAVAPVAVRDDSGYNLISLQCPQMQINEDVVIWGYYLFRPRYSDDYYFDGLKLSFGYDALNDSDIGTELSIYPSDDFYSLSVNNNPVRNSGILTVNSISFIYGTQIRTAYNREFSIFDFSSSESNLYPVFMFHSIGSVNIYSLGSFCYNFYDSGLYKLDDNDNPVKVDDEEKHKLSEAGNDRSHKLIDELGYIPVNLHLNTLNDGFEWNNTQTYDFTSVADLLGSIFAQPFIVTLMTACAVVGLIGLVLYGKR